MDGSLNNYGRQPSGKHTGIQDHFVSQPVKLSLNLTAVPAGKICACHQRAVGQHGSRVRQATTCQGKRPRTQKVYVWESVAQWQQHRNDLGLKTCTPDKRTPARHRRQSSISFGLLVSLGRNTGPSSLASHSIKPWDAAPDVMGGATTLSPKEYTRIGSVSA